MSRREEYQWYKRGGICPVCRKNAIQKGYQNCLECRMNMRDYMAERRAKMSPEQREKLNAANRARNNERYRRLKAAGICTSCGKREAISGEALCDVCKARRNRRQRELYEAAGGTPFEVRLSGAVCFKCCGPLGVDSVGKMCGECHRKQSEIMKKVNFLKKIRKGTKLYSVIPEEPGEHGSYICEDTVIRRIGDNIEIKDGNVSAELIGSRWFISREEAEKAMEGRGDE